MDVIKIASKHLYMDGAKIIDDKTKKPLELNFKQKKVNIKKAFKLKILSVMFVFDYKQNLCFSSAWNSLVSAYRQIYKEKFFVYFQNASEQKLIAAEGIFCASIAEIIFRIITSFGEYIWKQLKTKLKKSSTV